MTNGSLPLAAALALAWAVVYAVTQVWASPPLGVAATVLIGVALSLALTIGYPSTLRGPRSRRSNLTIAAVGRSRPLRSGPLRSGLTPETARRTIELLYPMVGADAVAIADQERVLGFVGPGSDHHTVGDRPQTEVSAKALARGRTIVVRDKAGLGCPHDGCPLRSAVIAPLAIGKRVVGILKVYRVDEAPPPRDVVEGLAGVLSLHLELAELDRERQLAVDAKLDALRAQINPHFLFNTLNTIASKARTDSEEARRLLVRLSDFFRYVVRQDRHLVEFGQEYFFVRTYLSLEQARYGERLRIRYDIEPQVLAAQVPVLTIQPLVENAVKHGLADKLDGGTVTLKARVDPLTRTTHIRISDDGVGMPPEVLERLSNGEGSADGGVGLRNISQRMEALYGERYRLDIRSKYGDGTTVEVWIPMG